MLYYSVMEHYHNPQAGSAKPCSRGRHIDVSISIGNLYPELIKHRGREWSEHCPGWTVFGILFLGAFSLRLTSYFLLYFKLPSQFQLVTGLSSVGTAHALEHILEAQIFQ